MRKILLVEDDQSLGTTLKALLEKEGFDVHLSNSKTGACTYLASHSIDLALLDVGLPDGNGFEVAAQIRSSGQASPQRAKTPIIFLSAMNSAEYRLQGFELGGDDYIPKPFHLRELLLRISRVFPKDETSNTITINRIVINTDRGCILRPNQPIEYLAKRELQILKILLEHAPRIVTREQMINTIQDINGVAPNARTIDNSIVRLRQLLAEANCECIRAVRGMGYQWIAGEN